MATRTIRAVYDGKVFRPIEPIELEPDTEVEILIQRVEPEEGSMSVIETALSLRLDGPEDWSENIHKYLYGNVGDDEE